MNVRMVYSIKLVNLNPWFGKEVIRRLTGCPYFIPDILHLWFTTMVHFHRWEWMVDINISSSARNFGSRCYSGSSCGWFGFFIGVFTSKEPGPFVNSGSPSLRPLVGSDRLCYGRRCCAYSPQTQLWVDSLVILFVSVVFYGLMSFE